MSTRFTKEGHTDQILQKLWQKCQNEVLCDVVLIAGIEKRRIPAHRNILLEASEFFSGIFTPLVGEGSTKEVEIPNVNDAILQRLIEYCYKGSLVISEDIAVELLKTAHMLLLRDVVTACRNFLLKRLQPSNCLKFMLLAEHYHCELLLQKSKEYSLEHFLAISRTTEFLQLTIEQLTQLLGCDGHRVTAEEDIFNSLKAWFEHDPIEREQYKVKLLKLVRMTLLERKFLIEHVKPVCTSVECLQIYMEAIEYHLSYDCDLPSSSNLTKSKTSDQILMGVSISYSPKSLFILYYCPQQHKWMKCLKEMECRFYFVAALMENCLYIIGGTSDRENILNTVTCLNLDSMTLTQTSPMTESRIGCCAATLNRFLYVMGGSNGERGLNSVEKFDPETNEWVKVASMSVSRRDAGVAVLNEKLYVVGGRHGLQIFESAECYDPVQDVWQSIAPMGDSRHLHGLAVAYGLLYALSGWGTDTAECYDPQTNQWTFICSLRKNLDSWFSCTTLNDNVVIFRSGQFDEYDTVANEWKEMKSIKYPSNIYLIFTHSGKLPTSQFVEI